MRYRLTEFLQDENGGPAIEFALMATLIALSVPVMIDMATLIDTHSKLSSGIRAGEQYALKYPEDEAGIGEAVIGAGDLSDDNTTVTAQQFCECNGIAHSCATNCGGGVTLSKYTSITVDYDMSGQYNYNPEIYPPSISKTIAIRTQ